MAKQSIRAVTWGIAVARRLCTAPSLAKAEAVAAAAGTKGGESPMWRPLYRRLSALGGAQEGRVTETMNGWLKEGRMVTEVEMKRFVRELRRYNRHRHALELMDWMESRRMKFSFGDHAVRLNLISKIKGMDAAEEYFSSLPDLAKNQQTYGALLNSYIQEKRADKAFSLYEKMKELNFASTTLVQNNLMTLYMKLGQHEKVVELFKDMKANDISPDNFTCCMLMNSYAAMNDIDSVERVIEEMKEGGISLGWTIYSNLAAHYNSAGLFQKAQAALKRLEVVIDKRDRTAFHCLVSLYAGVGNLAEVKRVWKSLKAAFTRTTNLSYLIMLQALNKLDNIDELKQCFEEWESACVTYDVRLANVLIGAYLRKEMVKEALTLWEKAMQKSAHSDFRTPELFTSYYLKRKEMDLALKCLEVATNLAKKSGRTPKKELVNEFMKYFEEVKDVDRVESFCKILKQLDHPDAEAYESLLG
ncbi:pentatricopeptide repeat-containing protein, mitochondrial [Cocos nucifera]|uniref:Pentatricopeptide repeat-containing protein, mitochondrial n=1 Tax=Cocos nucifera TaxID=13894 RepID=A0A8K0N061_COCNU|nr:pentatricopeptide repeat-containing protein, mitochondrial [Cocos nucifera]